MTLTDKIQKNLKRRYLNIQNLVKNRQIKQGANELLRLDTTITNLLKQHPDCSVKLNGMLITIQITLGRLYTRVLDNSQKAVEFYMNCKTIIERCEGEETFMFLYQAVLCELGSVLKDENTHNALLYLHKAEEVYKNFKSVTPVDVSDMFGVNEPEKLGPDAFEEVYLTVVRSLANIYESKKCYFDSAVYTHISIKIRLKNPETDYIFLVIDVAKAGVYFIKARYFKQARHHLAFDQYLLDKYERILHEKNEYASKVGKLKLLRASLAINWMKYGVDLLRFSNRRLSEFAKGQISDLNVRVAIPTDSLISEQMIDDLVFEQYELARYEKQVRFLVAATLSDARQVFSNNETHQRGALEFFSDPCSEEHINILYFKSTMYNMMSKYPMSLDSRLQLTQDSVAILEKMAEIFSKKTVSEKHAFIMYELGDSYNSIVLAKKEKCVGKPTALAAKTINGFIQKSIDQYRRFLNFFGDKDTEALEGKELIERQVAFAAIQTIILYNSFINIPPKGMTDRLPLLRILVDYCSKNLNIIESMSNTQIRQFVEELGLVVKLCLAHSDKFRKRGG